MPDAKLAFQLKLHPSSDNRLKNYWLRYQVICRAACSTTLDTENPLTRNSHMSVIGKTAVILHDAFQLETFLLKASLFSNVTNFPVTSTQNSCFRSGGKFGGTLHGIAERLGSADV